VDDHAAAYRAFVRSCDRVLAAVRGAAFTGKTPPSPALLGACDAALRLGIELDGMASRGFFEQYFVPHLLEHGLAAGMVTGYYEPVVEGSRTRTRGFNAPLLRRPADLVNLVDEADRASVGSGLTHVRRTAGGVEPFPTREQIDKGALAGKGLELVWLADRVEVFMMQVQGSGLVRFADGTSLRVTYDGKNGHPYTSIGRHLIETGVIGAERMSLAALSAWLRADPARGRRVMWRNASYVFFRELTGAAAEAPLGAWQIPLSEGRSLAVDPAYHVLGAPVFVSAPTLTHARRGGQARGTPPAGFHRLMVAQDVGSAIKGPERGDIYFGSGEGAGRLAGVTKHPARLIALLPAATPGDTAPTIEAKRRRRTRMASP
jgi:membrane-bound lytic murein transglycosylase A